MNGARWVQQRILEQNAGAALKVYAVWYAMFRGDTRERWRMDLLADPRVGHWWDDGRVLGRRLRGDLGPHEARKAAGSKVVDGPILWDAYLLFDREVRWDAKLPRPVSWGYTILSTKEALAKDLRKTLETPR